MPSWEELIAAEPRLAELEDRTREIGVDAADDRHWCASEAWYRFLVPDLVGLVGRDRDAGEAVADAATEQLLRSGRSYDRARAHLRGLLPACRHEGDCLW